MNCQIIFAASLPGVCGDPVLPIIAENSKSSNYCIKRLFESKSGCVDTPSLGGVFDLQGPLVQLIAIGSGDFCGELHRLFERQFIKQP